MVAPRPQIIDAIQRHYEPEQESVDSMLVEFTDTQIDFTEMPSRAKDIFETDFDLLALADEAASRAVALDDADTDLESSEFDLAPDDLSSVDEMLENECSFELTLSEEPGDSARDLEPAPLLRGPAPAAAAPCLADRSEPTRSRTPLVQRHATVRYYYRMNPLRMYPLMVVISRKTIREIEKKNVTQKRSQDFEVALDSVVEIEPILPGCQCYPPKEQLTIGRGEVSVRFHVVPHVLGNVDEARVVVRQNGQTLAQVPLEARVMQQSLTLLMGALSLVLPFGLMVLKNLHLDFESQVAEDFSLYAQLGHWLVQSVRPETMTLVLLGVTLGAYLWLRPRQRDVFWDLQTVPRSGALAEEDVMPHRVQAPERRSAARSTESNEHQAALLLTAEQLYSRQEYGPALQHFRSALVLGKAKLNHYHHASLCAYHVNDKETALSFLKDMEAKFPAQEVPGAIWYNMGCFCVRLGRYVDAIRHLNRAADAGYDDAAEYRNDPDLAPLRWRSDFKRLLGSLKK